MDLHSAYANLICLDLTCQLTSKSPFSFSFSNVYADGHTYEKANILKHISTRQTNGLAITSPTTNLDLEHLNLAPNFFARSAINEAVEAERRKPAFNEEVRNARAELAVSCTAWTAILASGGLPLLAATAAPTSPG